jgi:hypothetical protein
MAATVEVQGEIRLTLPLTQDRVGDVMALQQRLFASVATVSHEPTLCDIIVRLLPLEPHSKRACGVLLASLQRSRHEIMTTLGLATLQDEFTFRMKVTTVRHAG